MVQRNWFSDVAECTWATCIQWRQRTNFIALGCISNTIATAWDLGYASAGSEALRAQQWSEGKHCQLFSSSTPLIVACDIREQKSRFPKFTTCTYIPDSACTNARSQARSKSVGHIHQIPVRILSILGKYLERWLKKYQQGWSWKDDFSFSQSAGITL